MKRVYLDHNATAPLRPEARAAMVSAMDVVGNPSSVHAEGRAAKALVERARAEIAVLVDAGDADVIFTSGATEAAALALAPYAGPEGAGGTGAARAIVASEIEHDCIRAWAGGRHLLTPGRDGRLDRDALRSMTFPADAAVAVAVQAANSETGVLQDVAAFAGALDGRVPRPVLVTDAVQAVGKVPWSFERSRADMALVSAHKIGGPKGIGALVVRRGFDIPAMIRGGGQEMGRRSGTENVIGIAGFGAAAAAAARDLADGTWDRVAELRNVLEKTLEDRAEMTIFVGKESPRLPNTSCLLTPGWKGETQVMQMDLAGFAISAGSACSSGKVRASAVLTAMRHSEADAASAIRVSLGPGTDRDGIEAFAEAWARAHDKHRARRAGPA
ncbi:aminotransferase class V-fold PLP-dependent enzyme [Rhodobacterales bacterium HKCCE2091]|nr:aminotransferase class V-fold PLP-dependent enzyme [Rhodobacterales bacterium HKCCE2091]